MGFRRKGFGIMLAALAIGVFCSPASALAGQFKGKSNQGRAVELLTRGDGTVQRFEFDWKAKCRNGATYTATTFARGRFGKNNTKVFEGSGGYGDDLSGYADRALVTLRFSGVRLNPRSWSGRFEMKVRLKRGGRPLTFCEVASRWRVFKR